MRWLGCINNFPAIVIEHTALFFGQFLAIIRLLAGSDFCLNRFGLNCANIFGNPIMTNCPIRAISGQWFINAQKA
jgi:hypothetical protein